MKICIIDYGMGNITSVFNAIKYLKKDVELVSDANDIVNFDVIILPGVGAFPEAMEVLANNEIDIAIKESVIKGKRLVGICLGMQLLFSESTEFGLTKGLNLVEGRVMPFSPNDGLQIPHMGWNTSTSEIDGFKNFNGNYYFVHSYYCSPKDPKNILFETNYGIKFCSGIKANDQIFGFQFHPEKSQNLGIQLLDKVL